MLFIFLYIFLRLAKQSQFIPLQNVVYFITLSFLVRKIFTFYITDVLLFKCPFTGPKVNQIIRSLTTTSPAERKFSLYSCDLQQFYYDLRNSVYWSSWRWSQWPRGLWRKSAASPLLDLRVRIPPAAWISVSCECCRLSGGRLCEGTIPF